MRLHALANTSATASGTPRGVSTSGFAPAAFSYSMPP
jgi:hypothetical protein